MKINLEVVLVSTTIFYSPGTSSFEIIIQKFSFRLIFHYRSAMRIIKGKENYNLHNTWRLRMDSISTNNQIITFDLTRFAGRIGNKRLTFLSIIKITISLSIFFAIIMLLVRQVLLLVFLIIIIQQGMFLQKNNMLFSNIEGFTLVNHPP